MDVEDHLVAFLQEAHDRNASNDDPTYQRSEASLRCFPFETAEPNCRSEDGASSSIP